MSSFKKLVEGILEEGRVDVLDSASDMTRAIFYFSDEHMGLVDDDYGVIVSPDDRVVYKGTTDRFPEPWGSAVSKARRLGSRRLTSKEKNYFRMYM